MLNSISVPRRSLDRFRRSALFALIANLAYMVWLSQNVQGEFSFLFYASELALFTLIPLHLYNHWRRRYELSGGGYSLRTPVDVYIPTIDEPIEILRASIKAASEISYPLLNLYVLDDGNRPDVKKIAKQYGATYLVRKDRAIKKFKAANLNNGLKNSFGTYILTIDADNIVKPEILDDLLGHLKDISVAFVASRQTFTVDEQDFNHDHLFYEHIQSGKNADKAAISCGSGVVYRRAALESIGGFAEWSLVEDLYTSYLLNAAGWQSVYVSQAYVLGFAPQDIAAVYKQRGTWATDTLRMFIWNNPLLKRGLSFRQRLHYFELGWSYVVSGIFIPAIFLINIFSLLQNELIVTGGLMYLLFRIPALITSMWMFGGVARGQKTSRIWAGLFPVYFVSFFKALRYPRKKPSYHVTQKVVSGSRDVYSILPQASFILITVLALMYHLSHYGHGIMFGMNLFWLAVMVYWMVPVIKKGLFPEKPNYKNNMNGVVWAN